ncbi:MAG: helix-turn-helix domain-containing protein [Verrucomicrobiia bacterium]|jgi:AraC-like DNA-binding protein
MTAQGRDVLNLIPKVWYDLTMLENDGKAIQSDFFKLLPTAESIMWLFESLPQTYFYAKDLNSRFVRVNQPFLDSHGLTNEAEALGKTDRDFHPPLLAEAYISEDQRVMRSRLPLAGQMWLVLHQKRNPRWYVSAKTPLFSIDGNVVGLAGSMYRVEEPEAMSRHFQELLPVVTHIEKHYAEQISMAEMAGLTQLSSTHFNRRFRQLLRMSPSAYLRTVRVQASRRLLTTTSRTLAEIAAAVGFTDQSHFTKRFREVTGITPGEYRRRFVK